MSEASAKTLVLLRRLPLRPWLLKSAPALTLAALVFGWLLHVNLSAGVFEFDPDEGNNVIKALLVQQGYAYGTEIWTDQPPLFSYLLLPAFALFGTSMDVARAVASAMSAALVFGLYEALRKSVGHWGALTGALLLSSSAMYVPLSVSVMIGLPSVACLTLATLLAIRAGHSPSRGMGAWLAAGASGALTGAAIGIKLFAAPVAPVLFLTAMLKHESARKTPEGDAPRATWRDTLRSAVLRRAALRGAALRGAAFGAGLALALFLALAPLLLAGTFSGLVETHQTARNQAAGSTDGLSALLRFVSDDRPLFAAALLGTIVGLARRNFGVLPWLLWLATAGLALLDHSPVWPHHRLLLTVPAAALAGHAFGPVLQTAANSTFRSAFRFAVPAAALGLVALTATQKGRFEAMRRPVPWTSSTMDWQVFAEFSRYAKDSTFVAAARPTFAFRAGRPVPPNLAVTSWKRFRVGLLTNKRVASDVAATKPETVLLSSRWPGSVRAAVEKKIKKSHRRVKRWRHQSTDLWVSKALLSRQAESGGAPGRRDDSEP